MTSLRAFSVILLCLSAGLTGCLSGGELPSPPSPSSDDHLRCSDPCDVPISTSTGQASEPSVTVDPRDPDHMVAAYHELPPPGGAPGAFRLHTLVTWDGGRTWQDTRLPIGPEVPPDHPMASFTQSGDPQVAFLADGTVLLTGHGWRGAATDRRAYPMDLGPGVNAAPWLFAARSEDGGRTWEHMGFVHEGSGEFNIQVAQAMSDRPRLAVGPDGQALLVWQQNNNNHPGYPDTVANDTQARTYAVSLDGGLSWSEPAQLDDKPYGYPFLVSAPAIAADGTFYIAGGSLDPGTETYRLTLFTSQDAGQTWARTHLGPMAGPPATLAGAALATGQGPRGTILHIVYEEDVGEGETRPTYLGSQDGGNTWTEPIGLAEASPQDASKRPAVVEGPTGVTAVFQQPTDRGDPDAYTVEVVHIGPHGDLTRQRATTSPDRSGIYPGEWLGTAAL
ncbi:MAG: hypothetical protein R3185_04700, partial [Candidatus Thermoplasmatota archaeon]|nr:hypothetical protein [Candidatus Thermoplasmatota archaeon]